MNQLRSWLLPSGILVGAVVVAVVMVQLRPEPALRDPASRLPFVTTAAAEARQGSIPVHGAGTVRPRAEIDVHGPDQRQGLMGGPGIPERGQGRRGRGPLSHRRRRLSEPGTAGPCERGRSAGRPPAGGGGSADRTRRVRELPAPPQGRHGLGTGEPLDPARTPARGFPGRARPGQRRIGRRRAGALANRGDGTLQQHRSIGIRRPGPVRRRGAERGGGSMPTTQSRSWCPSRTTTLR